MIKVYSILILVISASTLACGQKKGDSYISVSIDSTPVVRLKFLSDSIVELSSIPRHMSQLFRSVHKYIVTDTTVQIQPAPLNGSAVKPTDPYAQFMLGAKANLKIIKGGLIAHNKSLIYVKQENFSKTSEMIYLINGKKFVKDMGGADGYGLIRKAPRRNRALEKELKKITKDNPSIEMVKGIDAYDRFGIEYVFGTVVIISA